MRTTSSIPTPDPFRPLRRRNRPSPSKARIIQELLVEHDQLLLQHRFFAACASKRLAKEQVIHIATQSYCFSTFYERLITLRIALRSTKADGRLVSVARQHLGEELGHPEYFRQCLVQLGRSPQDIARARPTAHTKALLGYLLSTIFFDENLVASVAIMNVMESIGLLFFRAVSPVIDNALFREHAEADEKHAVVGLDLLDEADDETLTDCRKVIVDLYKLAATMFDEWLEPRLTASAPNPSSGSSTRNIGAAK